MTSRRWLRRIPAPVLDAGLALVVAVTIAIANSAGAGRRPDALAYGLGLTIAALVLARRRWPLAVLLGSVAILQLHYCLNNPGIFPAVLLSVALCSAGRSWVSRIWPAASRRAMSGKAGRAADVGRPSGGPPVAVGELARLELRP